MALEERDYSVLVVSAAEKFNSVISELLSESGYRQVTFESGINSAKRTFSDRTFDFVIINSPFDEINEKVSRHGVYAISKPMSKPMVELALKWMATSRERLRKTEKKTLSIEEKMEEIRLVNRAKWLLISELKMDEPGAHRYIEKQAMDRCVTRREVAEEIIKTYS